MPGLESIVRAVAHLERRSAANHEVEGTGTAVVGTANSCSPKEQLLVPQQMLSPSPPRLVSTDSAEGRVVLVPPPVGSPKVMYHDGYSRFLPYYDDQHALVQERLQQQRQQERLHITNQMNPMLMEENGRHDHRAWIGGGEDANYHSRPFPQRMTQRFVSDHGIVIQVPPPLETMSGTHFARAFPGSICDEHPAVGSGEAVVSGKPSSPSPVGMECNRSESPRQPMVPPSALLKKAKKNATLSPEALEGLISPSVSTLLPRIAKITTDLDLYFASMEDLCKACQKEHGKKLFVPDPNQSFDQVEANDVLLGRGGETNHHTGNVQYRMVVKASQPAYLFAKRRDKPRIAGAIVCVVRALRGRFLKKGDANNLLVDVGNTRAREKTSQALREGAPELRGFTKSTEQATPERTDAASHPHNIHHHRQGPIPHEHLPVVSGHHSPSSSPPTHNLHHPNHEHQHHHATYYMVPPPPAGTLRQHHHDGPPPGYYMEHPAQYHPHHPHHGFSVAAVAPLQARMDYATSTASLEQHPSVLSLKGGSPCSHDSKLPGTPSQQGDPAEVSLQSSSDVAAAISTDVDSEEDRRNCAQSPSSSTTASTWSSPAKAAPSGSKVARGPRIKRLKKRLEETSSEQ